MKSLTVEKGHDIIDDFNSTSRNQDDQLNIDYKHIDGSQKQKIFR